MLNLLCFIFRQDLSQYVLSRNTNLIGNCQCSMSIIAGNHPDGETLIMQRLNGLTRANFHGIGDGNGSRLRTGRRVMNYLSARHWGDR